MAGPRRTGCCEQMRCLAVHVHGPSADPPVDIGDRLGRSLQDLVAFLSELHALGIDLFLHQQGLDTTMPAGKAMFQMMGVFAEFERAMIQERVRAGLARARGEGKRLTHPGQDGSRYPCRLAEPGRPGVRKIAARFGVDLGSVQRISAGPFADASAEPALL